MPKNLKNQMSISVEETQYIRAALLLAYVFKGKSMLIYIFYLHCPFGRLSQDGREYSFVETQQSIEEKKKTFFLWINSRSLPYCQFILPFQAKQLTFPNIQTYNSNAFSLLY